MPVNLSPIPRHTSPQGGLMGSTHKLLSERFWNQGRKHHGQGQGGMCGRGVCAWQVGRGEWKIPQGVILKAEAPPRTEREDLDRGALSSQPDCQLRQRPANHHAQTLSTHNLVLQYKCTAMGHSHLRKPKTKTGFGRELGKQSDQRQNGISK